MSAAGKTKGVSLKNNRKIKVFLFFLVLATAIWLLIELSKSFISTATFRVNYTNIPVDKLLQEKQISEIAIELKAPGFQLIKYKIRKHKISLSLTTVRKKNSTYYLLPSSQISYLNSQLSGETEIVNIVTDTIFVELGNNISKKVPVNPDLDLTFKLGYNLTDKLKLSPDSVTITGPEKYIDSVSEVRTEPVQLNDIYKNIFTELIIVPPLN